MLCYCIKKASSKIGLWLAPIKMQAFKVSVSKVKNGQGEKQKAERLKGLLA